MRRVPAPLAGLLVAVAIFGVAWACVIPPWQGPDEIQHYSYVETLAERNQLPGQSHPAAQAESGGNSGQLQKVFDAAFARHPTDQGPNGASTALLNALSANNAGPVTINLARPEQSREAFMRWRANAANDNAHNGGGSFPGSDYPPGYYAYEALGYLAAGSHANAVDHLYAARLFSVLWLLLTVAGAWCLAGELTSSDRTAQVLTAATVGLFPMLTFMSSMVNPDAMLYATWTWAFWAMTVVVRRGLTARRLLLLAAIALAALSAKQTSIALLPAAVFVIALGLWRLRRRPREVWLPPAALAGAGVLLAAVLLVVLSVAAHRPLFSQLGVATTGGVGNVKEFLSYVWQYYLPRLPGQQLHDIWIPVIGTFPLYNVWFGSGWGAFGWVTIWFPHDYYHWFLAITLAIALPAIARVGRAAWRGRGTPRLRAVGLPLAAVYGGTTFVLLLGLHLTEYKLNLPTNQGRYLFPLAALFALAVPLALRWLPRAARPAVAGLVLAGLIVFELGSLGYVATHYYA